MAKVCECTYRIAGRLRGQFLLTEGGEELPDTGAAYKALGMPPLRSRRDVVAIAQDMVKAARNRLRGDENQITQWELTVVVREVPDDVLSGPALHPVRCRLAASTSRRQRISPVAGRQYTPTTTRK
jgi:hypothetical protein